MRFGVRKPSLRGSISARTSWKRVVRHRMGFKAPRGAGFITNPKKALYNRIYNRTTISADSLFKPSRTRSVSGLGEGSEFSETIAVWLVSCGALVGLLFWLGFSFKWALILTVLGGIGAVVGEGGLKTILVLFLFWLIFLR